MTNIESKLDEIFSRLDEIEKRIGIQPKKLSDFLEDSYSIKDASKVLGCSMTKVHQFIKYDFLGLDAATHIHIGKELVGADPYEDFPEDPQVYSNLVPAVRNSLIFNLLNTFEHYFQCSKIMKLRNASESHIS